MNDHFTWAFGYCAARGYAPPVAATLPAALWFDVGKPDQAGRLILGDASGEAAAAFASVDAPDIYVDFAAPRAAILRHVPPHWRARDPMWLMATGAGPTVAPRRIADFTMEVVESDRRCEAVLRHSDGSLAARGVIGIHDRVAVYDQIVTEAPFARRGLGSAIMAELGRLAQSRGATESLLVATADGKALYERLGWALRSDIVSVISPP